MEKPVRTVIAKKKRNNMWYMVAINQDGFAHTKPWSITHNKLSKRRSNLGGYIRWHAEEWELITEEGE